jgi:peptidoglycan/LPS O-acetylase OafA/YrhL
VRVPVADRVIWLVTGDPIGTPAPVGTRRGRKFIYLYPIIRPDFNIDTIQVNQMDPKPHEIERNRINSLTATRGVAALAVVVFHCGCEIFPFNKLEHLFRNGNLAVSYFFVLSGFVMCWTYHHRPIKYLDFLKRRAARIFPLYFFSLALSILLPLYYYLGYSIPLEEQFPLKLLLNTLFLQGYFPAFALSLNPAAWSLSVELFFYLLFPFLLYILEKKRKLFFICATLFFIVSQLITQYLLFYTIHKTPFDHNLIFYHPVFHLNEFLSGMLGAVLLMKIGTGGRKIPIIPVLALILIVIFYCPQSGSLHNGLLAPFFLLFMFAVSLKDPAWMKYRLFIFLGEISYGIYILQFPVHTIMELFNRKYFHFSETMFFYAYLFILLMITIIAHYLVDRPLRKIILHHKPVHID